MRIVDNPPKSRNEKLASLMRRLNMCEELGRGWDRMVISCELQRLPAPRIQIYQESTKVSLFSHLDYTNIPVEDKLWSTYLHACIKFTEGEALTNTSLRERFGVAETSAGSISRLIKEAVNKKLIRPVDPTTAPRYMKYIPIWAWFNLLVTCQEVIIIIIIHWELGKFPPCFNLPLTCWQVKTTLVHQTNGVITK